MDEPTVQVPVSLIERARLVAELHGSSAVRDELDALLSRPALTAEPANDRFGHAAPMANLLHTTYYGATDPASTLEPNPDCPVHLSSSESHRIVDMAPGTTFWARTRDGVLSSLDRFWMKADNGWVFSTEAHHLKADRIDPSTIRDVTSPTPTT